jgi:TetR/AcrR family transcriptional regulator
MIREQAAALFARHGYPSTSMNQVAQACALSKAALYHYYPDKYSLLLSIADGHVSRLLTLVKDERTQCLTGEARLRHMIHRIVEEYADAQDAHRVLTEDVKFLNAADREQVLDKERVVVQGFAEAVTQMRADMPSAHLSKPLTMLLFGMINWMFTWMKPNGELDHAAMGPIVADLFLGGIAKVTLPDRDLAPALPAPAARGTSAESPGIS